MSAAVSYERVREHLDALSMEAALDALDVVLEACLLQAGGTETGAYRR